MNHRSIVRRTAFLALAGFCIAVVFLIDQVTGSKSSLSKLAQILTVVGSFVCLAATLLSDARWSNITSRVVKFLAPCPVVDQKRAGQFLLAVAGCCYLSMLPNFFFANDEYKDFDEEAYLITAHNVAAKGGPTTLVRHLYQDEFPEANRHPLYIGLLSAAPKFRAGKVLSVSIALISLIAVAVLGVRSIGWFQTGLMSVLLATNLAFIRFSVIVGCEVLIILLIGLLWFHGPRQAHCLSEQTPQRRAVINAVIAGGLLALTWLTKGTGVLFTIGYVVWLLSLRVWPIRIDTVDQTEKPQASRRAILSIALLMVTWMVVASPLLARNIQRFGSPFYNVNSWLMFVDEYVDPVQLSESQSIGQAASDYWETHTVSDIAQREARGVVWESFILIRMLGPTPLAESRVLFGLLVLGFAAIGMVVGQDPRARLLMIWLAVCILMFAWYVPVAAGERFVFPLLIPIFMFTSIGVTHVFRSKNVTVAFVVASAGAAAVAATWLSNLHGRI